MIETTCKVKVYRLNGCETPGVDAPYIDVQSVPLHADRVRIVVGGTSYEVVRADLRAALDATAHTGAR